MQYAPIQRSVNGMHQSVAPQRATGLPTARSGLPLPRRTPSSRRLAPSASASSSSSSASYPSYLPSSDLIGEIGDQDALAMLRGMTRVPVSVSFSSEPIGTNFAGPAVTFPDSPPSPAAAAPVPQGGSPNPLVLLHGFDSSSLEFRRFFKVVRQDIETYSLDLLGEFINGAPRSPFSYSFFFLCEFFLLTCVTVLRISLNQSYNSLIAPDATGWGFSANGQVSADLAAGCPIGPEQKREHLYKFWKDGEYT
jgi:hypothetical protein